jgi:hypothetical protein
MWVITISPQDFFSFSFFFSKSYIHTFGTTQNSEGHIINGWNLEQIIKQQADPSCSEEK